MSNIFTKRQARRYIPPLEVAESDWEFVEDVGLISDTWVSRVELDFKRPSCEPLCCTETMDKNINERTSIEPAKRCNIVPVLILTAPTPSERVMVVSARLQDAFHGEGAIEAQIKEKRGKRTPC